jgi:hypothetical protein
VCVCVCVCVYSTLSFALVYMNAHALPAREQGESGGLALVVMRTLSLVLSPLAPPKGGYKLWQV